MDRLLCFLLLFGFVSSAAGCKPMALVVPLFSAQNFSFFDLSDYFNRVIDSCAYNSRNWRQTAILPRPFDELGFCVFSGYRCITYVNQFQVQLEKKKAYNLKEKLTTTVSTNLQGCVEDSVMLILTDVPCEEYADYPDVLELFGDDGFKETLQLIDQTLRIYTFVYFLRNNETDARLCAAATDYEPGEKDFLQLVERRFAENVTNDQVCNKTMPRTEKSGQGGLNKGQVIGVIVGSCAFGALILALIVWFALRVRRRYKESQIEWFAEQHAMNARKLLFGRDRKKDEWELLSKDLKVDTSRVLGSGISATVYRGELKKKRCEGEEEVVVEAEVAVKVAHSYAAKVTKKAMLQEIELMKVLPQHEHLVRMFGCVAEPEQPVLVTEFCANGDLHKILKKHKPHFKTKDRCSDVPVCLLLPDVLRIAAEVCAGMAAFSALGNVHRDLAARNVFLTQDLAAKVGDFGLCRTARDASRKEKGEKLPITHMPLEALKTGVCSEKSDVWSFGVLLFELFNGGRRPFADIEVESLATFLEDDPKPEWPKETPDQVRDLANSRCFTMDVDGRATFAELQDELADLRQDFQ